MWEIYFTFTKSYFGWCPTCHVVYYINLDYFNISWRKYINLNEALGRWLVEDRLWRSWRMKISIEAEEKYQYGWRERPKRKYSEETAMQWLKKWREKSMKALLIILKKRHETSKAREAGGRAAGRHAAYISTQKQAMLISAINEERRTDRWREGGDAAAAEERKGWRPELEGILKKLCAKISLWNVEGNLWNNLWPM